jgi:GAF domain-containing protein
MMERFGARLFPDESGAIYLYRASRNQLEMATAWGGEPTQVKWFPPEDCWALRRGREHVSVGGKHDVCCPHLLKAEANPANAICIPMMAHGETTGLLVLESRGTAISEATQRLAILVAERIGLALSNPRSSNGHVQPPLF